MMDRTMVYICSPLRGDVTGNRKKAIMYSRMAYEMGVLPVTPHAYLTLFLDDSKPAQRYDGMEMGMQLLRNCHELWVFGNTVSLGMRSEIAMARRLGMPMRAFTQEGKPIPLSDMLENTLYRTSVLCG